jgi:uncharacterized protein
MMVFMDTFGLLAWLNQRDACHARVSQWLDSYTGRFLTTEWVPLELADALSPCGVRETVVRFLPKVRTDPAFEIVGYETAVYDAGFDLFSKRPDKDWSLTDCISFVVMTQRGLTDALTADHHFEQAGFRAIFK